MHNLAKMLVLDTEGPMADLVDELAEQQEAIIVAGKTSKAVLIGEQSWEHVQEALYLLSVPGVRESLGHLIETLYDDGEFETAFHDD